MASAKAIPESKALPARDAAIRDENDWPEYHMRNVEVTDRHGRPVSLLQAEDAFPVTVTGMLDLGKAQEKVLLPYAAAKSTRPTVQVKNVTHFSYGAYQNGDVDIWAAGEAGWYRIKPAESFVDIFQTMIEAVNIVYFTADCYKSGKLSADDLFSNYAQIHHITPLAAKEKFYGHARFLASRMKKGEEGVKWGHTAFYQHLRKVRPEAFNTTPTTPTSAPVPAPAPVRSTSTRLQKEIVVSRSHSSDERPAARSRRLRGAEPASVVDVDSNLKPKTRQKVAQLPSKVNKANAITLWKFMQKVVRDNRPEPASLTLEAFAEYIYHSFAFDDEDEAATYLLYLAAEIVSMMQQKRRRNYEWPELPVYDELLEGDLTPAQKRKMAGVELERRAVPLVSDDSDEISSVDSDSAEEEVMSEDEMAHHRKSGLRPKSGSKFSGKGKGRKGKGKGPTSRVAEDDEDDEDGEPMDVDTPSKRKSISEDEDTPPKKRFTRSQGDQDPELEDLEFAWQQAKSVGIPIRRKTEGRPLINGDEERRLAIVAEPIFSTKPTDPGDVWTCPHQGCLHKVYGASEEDGKELILEHLDEHKRNHAIDLILSEQGRTHLPVSNLIKRIREMAEAQNGPSLGTIIDPERGTPVTTLFPQPVMRRV